MSAEPTTAPVASTSTAAAAALDVPNSGAAPAPAPKVPKSARGRPTDDPDTRWSKTLSYILRHGAAKEGLQLRPDGFVRVEDLVSPRVLSSSSAVLLTRQGGCADEATQTQRLRFGDARTNRPRQCQAEVHPPGRTDRSGRRRRTLDPGEPGSHGQGWSTS